MTISSPNHATAPPYSPAIPAASPARRYWLARWRLRRWQSWLAKWRARRRNRKALARLAAVGGLLLAFSGPLVAASPPRVPLPYLPTVAQTAPIPDTLTRTSNFPAVIDLAALDGSDGFRLDGVDAYDKAGRAVSGVGDVNGDGFDDFLIGAPWAYPGGDGGAGESYLVFGGPNFTASLDLSTLNGTNGFRLDGIDAYDYSGQSVSGAGDINGDGFDDLLIGAPKAVPGHYNRAGESYVVFGAASFAASLDLSTLDGTNGFRLNGIHAYDYSGWSVGAAGDVNGDGFDDILIGAPFGTSGGNGHTGESYVVFGNPTFAVSLNLSTLDGTNGFRLDGIDDYDYSGMAVSGAGDVNGDGFDDLLIGAPYADPGAYYRHGESYVVFGAAGFAASLDLSTLDGTNGFRLAGIAPYDNSGWDVSGAGDVNGDGFADLLIGAPGAHAGGYDRAGESYLVFGAAGFAANLDLSSLDGTNGFRLDGIDDDDYSGRAVSGAGDVNGDGFADLLIGAPGAEPGANLYDNHGESYVVFGRPAFAASLDLASLDGTNGVRLDGVDAHDYSGYAVSSAGDVNGDGVDDILVGAPYADPGGDGEAGESYIVFGRADTLSVHLSTLTGNDGFRLQGIDAYDYSGWSVNGAGDVNGDGLDDILIGTPGRENYVGESYVVFGATAFAASFDLSTLDGTNGFRLKGVDAYDYSGWSVGAAGDVNGDGFDDLIVGAPFATVNGKHYAGESYVVFGAATFAATLKLSRLDGTNGFRLDGIDAYDHSGWAVSGAGDVNGDGFDDLLIGAPYADPNGEDYAGESYVVFGTVAFAASLDLSALDGTNGFRLDGIDAYDNSGWSVSGAGDVNGDGFDDLLIGAPSAFSAGESYVVFGAAGFAASLDLSALDGTNGFRLNGIAAYDGSGWSVSGAGDINGDGFDDLLIGAPGAAPGEYNHIGESYVVFGAASFAASLDLFALDGTNGFRLEGFAPYGYSGVAVSGVGDVNGDGFDDLLIGAPCVSSNGNYCVGESYLVFGAASFAASLDLAALNSANGFRLVGTNAFDQVGNAVSGAGDINGDGFDDLLIGAPPAETGGDVAAGESYVFFGDNFNRVIQPGTDGDDTLIGDSSDNLLFPYQGDDSLSGGYGDDILKGGAGNDSLTGGPEDDWLEGGSGNDTYFFADNWGVDRVDETHARGNTDGSDSLDFSAVTADLNVVVGSLTVTSGANSVTDPQEDVEQLIGGSGEDTFQVTAGDLLKSGDLLLDGGGIEIDSLFFDAQGYPYTATGDAVNGFITVDGVTLTYQNMGRSPLAVTLRTLTAGQQALLPLWVWLTGWVMTLWAVWAARRR